MLNQAEFTFGMSNRILKTIKDNPTIENPQRNNLPQHPRDTDKLKPQQLMDMILLDARTYTIKYTATRKREENDIKMLAQNQLNDTVRLLELDDRRNKNYTDDLLERIRILKDNIQLQMDTEEAEKTRKYMAKRNLEAETPTKAFL